ncbi:hypothetical protein I4F81_012633 [Pyropia yezoensis]|uniref:Uncharacterized protein n=1 Tax=Pyropia yezoensis TaxID=2788 RepID=A0ACC3CJW8_PYRYE|nr:hypothetical protein I4F81_012633 [Neopyropia yezoensis]
MHLWGRQREAGQWCRLAPVTSPGGPFDPASVTADGRRGSRPGVSLLSKCHGPSTQAVPSLLPHSHTRTPCSARGRRFLSPLPPRPPPLSRTLPSVATMFMHPADAVLLRRSLRRVVPSLFLAGAAMEAFMIYVPIGGRTFYDVAKEKEAERRAEGGRVRDILRTATVPPGTEPQPPFGVAKDVGRSLPTTTPQQQQPVPLSPPPTSPSSAERPHQRGVEGE